LVAKTYDRVESMDGNRACNLYSRAQDFGHKQFHILTFEMQDEQNR